MNTYVILELSKLELSLANSRKIVLNDKVFGYKRLLVNVSYHCELRDSSPMPRFD